MDNLAHDPVLLPLAIALPLALVAIAAILGAKRRRDGSAVEPGFHNKLPGAGYFILLAAILATLFLIVAALS